LVSASEVIALIDRRWHLGLQVDERLQRTLCKKFRHKKAA
jgi:hypothetical protein